ncbi:dna repair [Pyrrhoderma noxium]|uniref:Postreplication repair E3 ubiquitin-protein ligase RAD18 n=1 Tax=Pyrrhoderma noxium TaxID=2282107 RepID=A0A286UUN6_9AGAM|nr:dna repair [Pyrrhoderma noxium]
MTVIYCSSVFVSLISCPMLVRNEIASVSDPTDFPSENVAPGLRKIDESLRCRICGEIFDAPMTLQCGHSFCSVCVRRSLRDRKECPQCRNPAEEIHLMKIVQLEELGHSWRVAREFMLKQISETSRLTKLLEETQRNLERPRKRRRVGKEGPDSHDSPSPMGSRRKDRSLYLDDSSEIAMEDIESRSPLECIPSSDVEENEPEIQLDQDVQCPLCSKLVKLKLVNPHIDSGCERYIITSELNRPQSSSKSAWSNVFDSHAKKGRDKRLDEYSERLPKQNYSVVKDKRLRELLADYQLATTGSREQLIARHSQFVLLFNANLDRSAQTRKSLKELRKEIQKWEEAIYMKKTIVDDAGEYMRTNRLDFKRQIESIKTRTSADPNRAKSIDNRNAANDTKVSGLPGTSNHYEGIDLDPPEDAHEREVLVIADSQDESELLQ